MDFIKAKQHGLAPHMVTTQPKFGLIIKQIKKHNSFSIKKF